MTDVAMLAGVSPMTVSRVVNGSGPVREVTRRKVDAAMASLRYAPNREARHLAGCKPIRIGFFYSGRQFAGDLGEFLLGLLTQASQENVQVLVEKCHCVEQEAAQLQRMVASGLDGIILAPLSDDEGAAAVVGAAGMPAVAIDCGEENARVSSIGVDGYEAAYRMTRHLILLGHRRIGFLSASLDDARGARRLAGYRDAMKESGAEPDADLVVPGSASYHDGLDAAEYLLGLRERPTAVFAGSGDMAAATVAAAHCLGLDVPGDLTVTGFGDTLLAKTIWPQLTTIRQPSAQMAGAAVESLVRRVRGLRQGFGCEPEHVCLEFELVRRQSDAAPRARPKECLPPL